MDNSKNTQQSQEVEKNLEIIHYIISNFILPGDVNRERIEYVFSSTHNLQEFINTLHENAMHKGNAQAETVKIKNFSPQEYLEITISSSRILVVGGGLKHQGAYLNNMFLTSLSTLDGCDLEANLGKTATTSIGIKELIKYFGSTSNKFDEIIFEHVDITIWKNPITFQNIKLLLKSGGKLTLNPLISSRKMSKEIWPKFFENMTKSNETKLLEIHTGAYYLDLKHPEGMPFCIFFAPETNYGNIEIINIENHYFENILKPYFQINGFEKISYIKNEIKHKTKFNEEHLMQMTLK